jgi:hypothetical protein
MTQRRPYSPRTRAHVVAWTGICDVSIQNAGDAADPTFSPALTDVVSMNGVRDE